MKTSVFYISGILLVTLFYSCSKSGSSPITINGDWNLVKDSVVQVISAANVTPDTTINIYDKAGDYYNFSSNGKLYMRVDGFADTATYTMQQNNQISINYSEANRLTLTTIYSVENLSEHSVVLINPGQFLAPFFFKEMIRLNR
jgi:hypothetical protein